MSVCMFILAAIAGLFFQGVLGVLGGGISGWVVGLFFGDTFLGIFKQIGIENVTMFQIGAFLGFVASFFKPVVQRKSNED
mgnify:CR=1 FL=1